MLLDDADRPIHPDYMPPVAEAWYDHYEFDRLSVSPYLATMGTALAELLGLGPSFVETSV